jgi:hypothetical protein
MPSNRSARLERVGFWEGRLSVGRRGLKRHARGPGRTLIGGKAHRSSAHSNLLNSFDGCGTADVLRASVAPVAIQTGLSIIPSVEAGLGV